MRGLKGVVTCLLLMITIISYAQDHYHYIYIQSDKGQLFYVRENDRLLSSSSAGYMIIPQLLSGNNEIIIGFPRNQFPEQKFIIDLQNQDKGYLLKQSGSDKFVLYNLVDYAMVKPIAISQGPSFASENISAAPANSNKAGEKIKAATDTSKRQLAYVKPSAPKDTTPQADKEVLRFRKLLEAAANEGKPAGQTTIPQKMQPAKNIAAVNENTAIDTSRNIVDNNTVPDNITGNDIDTSSLDKNITDTNLISSAATDNTEPLANNINDSSQNRIAISQTDSAHFSPPIINDQPAQTNNNITESQTPTESANINAPQPQFITFSDGNSNDSSQNNKITGQQPGNTAQPENTMTNNNSADNNSVPMINSDCQHMISEDDFQKLRRKVAEQNSDASMLKIIDRSIRDNCFSTAQIQSLAYLLTTDESRFRLVQNAYPHIYDTDHFPKLINIFSDNFYQAEFKGLLKK